jgi:hypothetical protein
MDPLMIKRYLPLSEWLIQNMMNDEIEYSSKINIDNLCVYLQIKIQPESYTLTITSNQLSELEPTEEVYYKIYYETGKKEYAKNKTNIKNKYHLAYQLKLMIENLETLKFSKIKGNFIDENECKKIFCENLALGNLAVKPEICCVCHDETLTTTPCHHNLCYICWEKICKDTTIKCPICRTSIEFTNVLEE